VPRGARTRALLTVDRLARVHPARTELEFADPFQLLVATILSAQSTDVRANQLSAALLERYPDAAALADARLEDVEGIIRPVGFFHTKARTLQAAARVLVERFDGAVPSTMPRLLAIPGMGRKSANMVVGLAFGRPGIVTDRHLMRVAHRLRLVSESEPDRIERQLARLVPREDWTDFSLRMTLHGRHVCVARRPLCQQCVLNDFCPSSSTRGWPAEARLALSLSLAEAGADRH
jgi:endonuclease-3